MEAAGQAPPFRVNRYVIEALSDWDAAVDDPIFQLTCPQPGMLEPAATWRNDRRPAAGKPAFFRSGIPGDAPAGGGSRQGGWGWRRAIGV